MGKTFTVSTQFMIALGAFTFAQFFSGAQSAFAETPLKPQVITEPKNGADCALLDWSKVPKEKREIWHQECEILILSGDPHEGAPIASRPKDDFHDQMLGLHERRFDPGTIS